MNKAVFWDQDGTLVGTDGPYVAAAEALTRTRAAGYLNIIITNQPDVARGKRSMESVVAFHALLNQALPLDGIFVCYHDDADNCACRKPKPGLILLAAKLNDIDLAKSFMVGNEVRDMRAAQAAGCRPLFLTERTLNTIPWGGWIAYSLEEAADWILRE